MSITKQELELLEGVEVGQVDLYTDEEIKTLLKRLPRTKYKYAEDVANALITFRDAKRELDKVKAQMHLRARQDAKLTSDGDRKAWAQSQPETEAAEIALINAEAEFKMAEMRYEAYDDLFNAVRKLANMQIEKDQAIKDADKYEDRSERGAFYEAI